MPTLNTARLHLRNVLLDDWEAVNALLSDTRVTQYMHFANWDEAKRREWLDWCIENNQEAQPDVYNWAITLQESPRVIGWLGIGSPTDPTTANERDFGFALAPEFWGNGYMTEALKAVLGYEFEVLGAQRIFATCEIQNIASARVMQKAGMHYEKTVRDTDTEGNWADRHHYAIYVQDYVADREKQTL